MSVEAVAAILREQVAKVMQQRAVASAVIQKLAGARDALHTATSGADSPEATRSVWALNEGIRALQRASGHLGAASEHIAAYGPALGIDLTPSGTTPAGPGMKARDSSPRTAAAGEDTPASAPHEVERAASRLPPREGGRGPTQGWLLGADLQPVTDAPVRSGEDLSLIADLDLPARERMSRSLTSHVEAHIAAQMRRGEIGPVATLVLNNPVCRGPASCERFLASILPAGARLTIFFSDGDGPVRLAGTYDGTGERIKTL